MSIEDVTAPDAARDRRTRRLLTAGLVVALIAGPLAGFAIGTARDDGGGDVAVGGGTVGRETKMGVGDTARSSVAFGFGTPLDKLFFRTTADGVTIRAYRSHLAAAMPVPEPVGCVGGPAVDCPTAPECIDMVVPTAVVTGELSTEAAVTVASGAVATASAVDPDVPVSETSWGMFGVEEAAPARWVIATVSGNITRVRASFPGGITDEMRPIDGVVLLASQVADPSAAGGTVEALADDGSVVQSVDLTPGFGGSATGSSGSVSSDQSTSVLRLESSSGGAGVSSNSSSSVSSSASGSAVAGMCASRVLPMPDQPLPEPGEQPADPTAARAAIELAYSVSYDGTKSPEEKSQYQEAPTGIAPDQITAAGYGDQVAGASATVTDVVFTSPTTASVRYDIAVANWANQFPGRVGGAVLVDGTWKVARSTICTDISLAGVTCPPAK